MLVHLLVSLFRDAANMRTFVRSYPDVEKVDIDLPANLVSAITIADAMVVRLKAEGLVGPRF